MDFFTVKATVTFVKKGEDSTPWYNACPNDIKSQNDPSKTIKCAKKVTVLGGMLCKTNTA